jgi:rubrerythrin
MLQVNVQNGTRGAWRKVHAQVKKDWICDNCGARNRYYWLSCPNCKHPRPEED